MTPANSDAWVPNPELLAAYFDGEFEGRDDLTPLRLRLEKWLETSPAGRAELNQCRRLRQLWLETTPSEPSTASWQVIYDNVASRVHSAPRAEIPERRAGRGRQVALMAMAACALLSLLLLGFPGQVPPVADDAPFPVATEQEVVILRVDGADTGTLVVGLLPLHGPLELAGPGDVTLTSAEPAQRDNLVAELHDMGSGRPIIWARAEAEED